MERSAKKRKLGEKKENWRKKKGNLEQKKINFEINWKEKEERWKVNNNKERGKENNRRYRSKIMPVKGGPLTARDRVLKKRKAISGGELFFLEESNFYHLMSIYSYSSSDFFYVFAYV